MEALSILRLAVVERRGHTDEPPGKNGRSSALESFVCDRERPSGGDSDDSGSEPVEEPLMREICYLDKLVDELAKAWPLEKILRRGP